jgi:hypothetical protein
MTLPELSDIAALPWEEQMGKVFERNDVIGWDLAKLLAATRSMHREAFVRPDRRSADEVSIRFGRW